LFCSRREGGGVFVPSPRHLGVLAILASVMWAGPSAMADHPCGSGEDGEGVGGGELGDGGVGIAIDVHDCIPVEDDGNPGTGEGSSYTTTVIVDIYWGFQGGCAAGHYEALVEVRLVQPDGSWEHVAFEEDCWLVPDPGDPGVGGVVDPFSVTEEVRRALPEPQLHLSPDAGGITGMETWFWYDHTSEGLTPVDSDGDSTPDRPGYQLDLTIAGNTVTATVWPTGYRWHVDAGTILTSTQPGSVDSPAGRHTYDLKGDRAITVDVIWTGWWEHRAPGGAVVTGGSFQPFTMSGTHPYTVREVKAEPAD